MANNIKVIISDGNVRIQSPYHKDFVARIKVMGGKWDACTKEWVIREESLDAARAAMMEVYGETDAAPAETVTVIAEFLRDMAAWTSSFSLLGKTIASAWSRDSGAKVGNDCAFLVGAPESGGSAKNWKTIIEEGSVVEIYNVPKDFADREMPKIDSSEIRLTIKGAPKINREALQAEREQLLKRIAEIDELLAR